jgi:hypothetical protein
MDNSLIYIGDDKLIKNIDTKLKLKYFPLINKFGLDTKDISNKTILMYIIGYGFYAKFKVLHIIDKHNKLYNQLLSCYKLCEISTLYFIQYCDINYFDNIITMKNYQEYCKKNNKIFKSLPKNIELMNIVNYNATIIDNMLIVTNDDITLSDELRNDTKGDSSGSDDAGCGDDGSSGSGSGSGGSGSGSGGGSGGDSCSSDDDESDDGSGDDDESESESEGDCSGNDGDCSGNDGDCSGNDGDCSGNDGDGGGGGCVPILWIPCKKISINDYKNHIYTCKKCEFINNNNNICDRKKKIKVIIGKYDKLVDAYLCSSIYIKKKSKSTLTKSTLTKSTLTKSTLTVVKINNDKNFYNDCMFII